MAKEAAEERNKRLRNIRKLKRRKAGGEGRGAESRRKLRRLNLAAGGWLMAGLRMAYRPWRRSWLNGIINENNQLPGVLMAKARKETASARKYGI
jgi:hypothetical protein